MYYILFTYLITNGPFVLFCDCLLFFFEREREESLFLHYKRSTEILCQIQNKLCVVRKVEGKRNTE